jgi:CRISPR-associated protein Cmr6
MTKAALPSYMDKHLTSQDTPPGHRFGLYFPVWQDDWKKASEKIAALKKATSLPETSRKMAEALRQRQQAIALQNDALSYFPATSTSPFMTGIGNEHPLENGFAFLNPYGLPYLPGSSVKGVLRTAAEELALGLYGETEGWDMLNVWWLFGFEAGIAAINNKPYKGDDVLVEEAKRRREKYQDWVTKSDYDQGSLERFIKATVAQKDQKKYLEQPQQFLLKITDEDLSNQGALCFWDVYPQIPKGKDLAMDILTPHHGGYFQDKNAPHDSEQPNPNIFLTVPPGSGFDFYCTCTTERLPPTLQQNWRPLLQSAFAHAFDWLGFGAKTAVGYGQITRNSDAEQEWQGRKISRDKDAENHRQQQERDKKLIGFTPMAQDFIRAMEAGKWQEDKNAFWQNAVIETWLDKLMETPDAVVITYLNELFDKHFPGLRLDPDKAQGKKQKPVFSDRQRNLAKRLAKF